VDRLEQRIRELARSDAEARRRPVLSGAEIMKILDIPPGPSVGAAIEMLLSDIHSGNRDEAESLLRSWWSERETVGRNA
jgi:poly(A) polymerase